ncbi:TVP38/TMEM64 family protein [Trichothermofontia sp.]
MKLIWLLLVAPTLAWMVDNVPGIHPQAWLHQALQWIEGLGLGGGLAFMVIYIVATVALLPGAILTLGSGIIFGVILGSIYVLVGATIGAIAAFLVGRYLLRGWISRKIAGNPKFAAIDQAVAKQGFKIVLLTRLSPVFPFNFLNYAFGITGVTLKDYTLGSIGMIPGTVMYVYLGSLVGDLAMLGMEAQPTNATVPWVIQIVGFMVTVGVTAYVTRVARQALATEAPDLK